MNNDTISKLEHAIKMVRTHASAHPYTIAFSGGKDSVVLSFICKEAGLNLPMVYNMTTIDPPGTVAFCKEHGAAINKPQYTYLQLVEKKGLPTMFRRFCCKYLKERFISQYLITGVRASESVKRAKRYCDFERVWTYTKNQTSLVLTPLIHFSYYDIDFIIRDNNLRCHPLYYDNDGTFYVERRLGCIGCPLQGDRGRADFRQYPKLLASIAKRLVRFHENKGRTKHDAYLNLVYEIFYSNHGSDKYKAAYEGFFPENPKSVLENYFNIDLP